MAPEKRTLKKLRDIPGPHALPFFGTMLSPSGFGGKDLMRDNEEQVRKFGTIVKQENYWNYPIIQIFDPEDIDKVMNADKKGSIRPLMEILVTYRNMKKDRYSSAGIANTFGEHWAVLKSKLSLLSTQHVMKYLPNVNDTAEDFISLLRSNGPHISEFDKYTERVAAENSFELVLGHRKGLLTGDPNEHITCFLDLHKEYWAAIYHSSNGFPFWKYYPTRVWRNFVSNEDLMYKAAQHLIDDALSDYSQEGLFTAFLRAKDLDQLDKTTAVMDFTIAAIEPVTNSLNLSIYSIAKDDEVQKKLQAELKGVLPTKDTPINIDTIKQLPYLVACVKEGFRMVPATPNTARILEHDIELQGYHIPAQTMLLCQSWYACLLDENFYRAKEFIPERWLHEAAVPESEKLPHRQSLCRHFGFGKRMCPGRRYAFQELCIIIAKVFRNFWLEFPDGLKYNYEFMITPVKPISIIITDLPD